MERAWSGGRSQPTAWRHWDAAYQGILDLEVNGRRDEALVSQISPKISQIAGYRRERQNTAAYGLNPLFWTVAIVGLLLVVVPYMTFPPTFMNLTLLSMFGGYTGLVMFAIAAVANPYTKPGKLEPVGMNHLLMSEMANFYTGR